MTRQRDVPQRVETLLQRVFEVAPRQLRDETRRGELDRWDSLGHLALIEALREEFAIDIPPELALSMDTVADVKRITSALLQGQTGGSVMDSDASAVQARPRERSPNTSAGTPGSVPAEWSP